MLSPFHGSSTESTLEANSRFSGLLSSSAGSPRSFPGLTSQLAAGVPGRFFEAYFLSGRENGRFMVDRA